MVKIDMELPEACFCCRFCIDIKTEECGYKYVKCAARGESYLYDEWTEAGMIGNFKPEWCPLIEE